MIAYKVVRQNRKSAIVGGLKDYSINYPVGKIVSAKKGTFGIFCFENEEQAIKFLSYNEFNNSIIIKVQPIGKKTVVKKIGFWRTSRSITNFYRRIKSNKKTDKINEFLNHHIPPTGTICYSKVKVLT